MNFVYKPTALTSKLLLHYNFFFKKSRILFAGNIQDLIPVYLECLENYVYVCQFDYWQILNSLIGKRARFGVIANKWDIYNCNTLIYFWPKNKLEAKFQLMNILSLLPIKSTIFIVGEKRSGVSSTEKILSQYISLNKIDNIYHCILYGGVLKRKPIFNLKDYWSIYKLGSLYVKNLPGVFSYNKIDLGSNLLLSTFSSNITGDILDIGCGSGVLSIGLAKKLSDINLTLIDNNALAIASSRATLRINNIKGKIFASNLFSEVKGCFDMIIANPQFHNHLNVNLKIAKKLIQNSVNYLNNHGELRIVANSFLPYPEFLNKTFKFYEILSKTKHFTVYRAFKKHKNLFV